MVLREIVLLKIKELNIYGAYKLVVNQVEYIYNKKDKKLITYKMVVSNMLTQFDKYKIENYKNKQYICRCNGKCYFFDAY